MISKRLASGLWRGVDRNVYAFASTPSSWRQRVLAACLAGPAVASHRAAGWLWSLPGMGGDHVEVTALRHRRRRASDVIWHESFHLEARDVTEVDGIPVTRPVRTFLDLASLLSEPHLEEVLNEGIRRNLMSVPAVGLRLQQLGQLRRGAGRARRVLDSYVPGQRPPESVLETRYLQLIRSAGLPIGVPQYEVRCLPGGAHASTSRIPSSGSVSSSTARPTTMESAPTAVIGLARTSWARWVYESCVSTGTTSPSIPTTWSNWFEPPSS
jgi:hypothetical protein